MTNQKSQSSDSANLNQKSVSAETMPTRLNEIDLYGKYEKQGKKKGRYGVTVPKPFAFDIRD